ncbi:MAG: hypothetical protein HC940_02835 [Acaryochloris sp. SU_5_25]|nr:hypothetical protein [Acaryochloris sp. SU_5_25]
MSAQTERNNPFLDLGTRVTAAAHSVLAGKFPKVSSQEVLGMLLEIEKDAQIRVSPQFAKFVGTWRLCFVTGTKKPHYCQGQLVGRGFYIPRWVKMQIVYSPSNPTAYNPQAVDNLGQIANQVNWGGLSLSLTGPARCWPKKNIMVFDFTRLQVKAFGKTLYNGFIRGGQASEQNFWSEHVRTQAFFAYFLVHDQALAARGRGGGIALWVKTES